VQNDTCGVLRPRACPLPPTQAISQATKQRVDEEVASVIAECYDHARELVRAHRDDVAEVATLLLEKETITRQDVEKAIGARPFPDKRLQDEFHVGRTEAAMVTVNEVSETASS
jgi:ATP-dependent Zn protease